ncbi:MAG TPA: DUF3488 and transglutaminase-like domain-containing protein [Candidatus Koribacter sp.]|jgi:transglutaminase-like putative cysteine protease
MATTAVPEKMDLFTAPRIVPEPIERFFQVSLFLLLITGFVTLAGTGKLDIFSVLFVLGALAIRAVQWVKRKELVIPERWTTVFTLVYVLVYSVDYFFISRDFVASTVHLVLFGMVVKVFSIHRDRDLLYLGVLSFLMVLAASVLTVNTVFLGGFAIFLLVAIATFISFEMRRTASESDKVQPLAVIAAKSRPRTSTVNMALSRTAVVLALFILIGATALFYVLPRKTGGYLGSFARGSDPVSGFRDTVQLGQIGRIQQSAQIVMHVQLSGEHTSFDGKLRGAVLSHFDGETWSDSPRYMQVISSRIGHFDISNETFAADPYLERVALAHKTHAMPYRVIMEPTMSPVLFLAKGTLELEGNFRQIAFDSAQSYINLDGNRPTNTYWAVANITPSDPDELRASGTDYPGVIYNRYLQLPRKLDPRVHALAEAVTTGIHNNYDRARAVEAYLQKNFGYTLELPAETPPDPIADFLFNRKQGHCEYFASSMAIMLRTIGIPTRVVTGFRGGEYNDLTGSYIIRGSDAHAWVEAYFPHQGWIAFDPTASAPSVPPSLAGRLRLYADAFNEFWHEWVVNYDFQHQRALTAALTDQTAQRTTSVRDWMAAKYEGMLNRARSARRAFEASPQRQSTMAVAVILFLLILGFAPRFYRFIRAQSLASRPENAPEIAAALWYQRTTRHLARFGWIKSPSQTPNEFVRTIHHETIRRIVEEFTEHYEHARFGHSAESAVRLPSLFDRLKTTSRPSSR